MSCLLVHGSRASRRQLIPLLALMLLAQPARRHLRHANRAVRLRNYMALPREHFTCRSSGATSLGINLFLAIELPSTSQSDYSRKTAPR